ncbi:MAG: hypothetical protein KF794_08965 [Xanthobacteraceae bacterium]|nr:hypothetical protein [Xanthobacteraceae bacterium]QYK43934.1 MAG: hypothetical protein KF794_08965 [Xanthobacteraceae bacterium]
MPTRKLEVLLTRQKTVDEREIIALRNEYLLLLGKLAAKEATAPLIVKAKELLKSRYWAKSTWRERGKILETVGWLLRTHGANDENLRKDYI